MTLLGAAQERGKRLETELKDVDDTVRNQLLATWKELILEEMVELFAITDDPQVLRYLDSNIALGQEITRGKKMMVTICHDVFCLPRLSAGRIRPLALAIRRKPVIKKSRATTVVAAHAGTALRGTSEMNAAATMILSTSGSISLPNLVTIA